ncbi:MAG: hypothetical protein Q4A04_09710 [Eubacteriales bacterium]|nr:hypothetical protein [Eubacteriales bacterium]
MRETELKRNIAWVRKEMPVIKADGVFGASITMNPCAIIEKDTIFLFYAADSADPENTYEEGSRRREIHLATAPVSDPENFTHYGVVLTNDTTPGSFDFAWCVLPHVVKIRDGMYYMMYSGNCGHGSGLNAFPGLGAAWSKDLYHWEKYKHNPVLPPEGEPFTPIVGIAGGGLYKEDTRNGYLLHLFYTGCPTLGDNVFTDQQKFCCYATSTDGIHWDRHGAVHRRSTMRDYENIASTGGPAFRDPDGLWRHWYSAIGSRWGVYSISYAESTDGLHWARGTGYGENLALAPKVRDVGELHFLPWKIRWQDQSVSYPSVICAGGTMRMYYCGNDYGMGGIGTAVAAPMRLALTGEAGGRAKLWIVGQDGAAEFSLLAFAETADYGVLKDGLHEEGITADTTPFFEEFPEANGTAPLSVRVICVHQPEGIRIDWFAENLTARPIADLSLAVSDLPDSLTLSLSDAKVLTAGNILRILLGDIQPYGTVCVHGHLELINS